MFDAIPKIVTTDPGGGSGGYPGEMPAAGLVPAAGWWVYVPCAAGAGGAADDVTVFNATVPTKVRVADCFFITTTNVGSATVTLRDASAGGGNALSSALSSNATGTARNALTVATRTVAQNGSIYIRRSDSGIAGEMWILLVPTL